MKRIKIQDKIEAIILDAFKCAPKNGKFTRFIVSAVAKDKIVKVIQNGYRRRKR